MMQMYGRFECTDSQHDSKIQGLGIFKRIRELEMETCFQGLKIDVACYPPKEKG